AVCSLKIRATLLQEKALSSKTEEERSVLEEMVDPPNSDALECMRNHYERIVLELRQREAHLCEELSRAREVPSGPREPALRLKQEPCVAPLQLPG
ncbi:hypothetical protein FOZ63_016666, partial [Perkinsus olseni]